MFRILWHNHEFVRVRGNRSNSWRLLCIRVSPAAKDDRCVILLEIYHDRDTDYKDESNDANDCKGPALAQSQQMREKGAMRT